MAGGSGDRDVYHRLRATLDAREKRGVLRSLSARTGREGATLVDFCSNDYLGLARDESVVDDVAREYAAAIAQVKREGGVLGSTGSRLLSGNNSYAEQLEAKVAGIHGQGAALLFTTGWLANFSVLACLPTKDDVVLFDELMHNSAREGIRFGRQRAAHAFVHNRVPALRAALEKHLPTLKPHGQIFIVVESVYSMEGDVAPLREICDLVSTMAPQHAKVIVDEAHGTGLFGPDGRGVVAMQGLEDHPAILCSIYTYGKAFGSHGAAVVGRRVLKEYLLNYARPLIYSTAMSLHSLVSISCAYDALLAANAARAHLKRLIAAFVVSLSPPHLPAGVLLDSPSPIQAVLVPGNDACVAAARALRAGGLDVLAVRAPTVPKGTERLRVILHAHNTLEEVALLTTRMIALVRGSSSSSSSTAVCTKTTNPQDAAAPWRARAHAMTRSLGDLAPKTGDVGARVAAGGAGGAKL